jgi:hypothetical protein
MFILFLVVSVSPRNTKLRPLTELFFKNSTAKIQPDQSPRPNGPRLMREVLHGFTVKSTDETSAQRMEREENGRNVDIS